MKYAHLGRSALRVSRVALGTVNFGWVADEPSSRLILDRAVADGCNLIDTANSYNREREETHTETMLGRWLHDHPGVRDRLVLATKVCVPVGDGPNDGGLSAWHIRSACEASLRRLRTDHIDLYQMHHVDRRAPWEEVWQAMDQLVRDGKVLYVGSSNFAGWHIALCQAAARGGVLGLVSEQSVYNLAERAVELEVLPACQALGLGLLAHSVLHGGILAGDSLGPSRRLHEPVRARARRHGDRLEAYYRFCRELGKPPAVVAVSLVLHRAGVAAAVIGPRTIEQYAELSRAAELDLGEEALARLEQLWPGPGPAPEAYAW
jgi:aryl-alcohol dehydrogenase-like predicted oxidoreductase